MQKVRAVEAPPKRLDPRRSGDESFDENELISVGFSRGDLELMQDRWEESKMEKLELADKLARGETAYPGESFQEIEHRLREDLGEDDYNAMLYSTHQMNEVALYNVLESSKAYQVGLRNGRMIYSYNGQRVFKPMELKSLMRETRPGETVAIEFEIRGDLVRVFVDSGLVGASYKSARFPPTRR